MNRSTDSGLAREAGQFGNQIEMFTAAECRIIALEKMAQAKREQRHRRKLTSAAEAWLYLAQMVERQETRVSSEADVIQIAAE